MVKIDTRVITSITDGESSVSKKTYLIKDYQRGYRWTDSQIIQLLEDINSFVCVDNQKYCMQPLIVKKEKTISSNYVDISNILPNEDNIIEMFYAENEYSESYEVIDGQQRLTTLLLIYCICCENLVNKPLIPYKIKYQYLRDIDKKYMKYAIDCIRKWFEQFNNLADDYKNKIRAKINTEIMFIWYEVDEEENSNVIFSKINEGKIPLTSSDLFKAKLINELNEKDSIVVSKEWDDIERALANDDFWYFLANEECDLSERMNYLLNIYVCSCTNEESMTKEDSYYTFNQIEKILIDEKNNKKIVKDVWEEIVQKYETLLYWYNDKELYHYVVFLIKCSDYNKKNVNTFELISNLMKNTNNLTKDKIKEYIISKIKDEFKNVKIDDLNYDNGNEIRKVLLYFNIKSFIKSNSDGNFSFKQFKTNKWDIEHIHAKATDDYLSRIVDKDKRKSLLENIKEMYKEMGMIKEVEDINNIIDGIDKILTGEDFKNMYNNLLKEHLISEENRLGNLTLLDEGINREYKNELFFYKRKKIVEKDKNGQFIPICTKNVFLKYYSTKTKNNFVWSDDDAEEYENEIKKVFEEDGLCQE